MDRLVGPHAARHESDRDLAVGHGLDVAVLAVHDSRPQDDVECVGDINDVLVDVDDGDVAAAARGGAEDGQLRLGRGLRGLRGLRGSDRLCARRGAVGLRDELWLRGWAGPVTRGWAHLAASAAGSSAAAWSGLTPPGASGGPPASPPVASQAASRLTPSMSTMSPAGQLRGPRARTSSVTRAISPARRTPSAALAQTS